jgi:hypothetical protein
VGSRRERVAVSLLYWALRRLLELFVLRRASEWEKEIEILLLRLIGRCWRRSLGSFLGTAGDDRCS